jgi:predicted GNAT family N-acyltransferase
MPDALQSKHFRDISLDDPFFDSLKQDYQEFPDWFKGKADETAYTQYTDSQLCAFMYLKHEDESITDVVPPMEKASRIKIGTLKTEAHGTKLGQRLIKKAFDHAIVEQVEEIYITIFPHHEPLISLLEEFGFINYGEKQSPNGTEKVLLKYMDKTNLSGDLEKDYPFVDTREGQFYLLGIYPQWHSQLFPDSILDTESYDLLSDVSHTNSIYKTYICAIPDVDKLRPRDKLVVYRTKDDKGSAEYRSVATSICVVEEIRHKNSFSSIDEYISYTEPLSVLSNAKLREWWRNPGMFVIKMLYNAALTKRMIRKTLIEQIGLKRESYWGFMPLTKEQFINIIEFGGVSDRLIID